MPELPELEVVCEVLKRRVIGQTITSVDVLQPGGPIVVRDLTHEGFDKTLAGSTFTFVKRRGKFLGPPRIELVRCSRISGELVTPSTE